MDVEALRFEVLFLLLATTCALLQLCWVVETTTMAFGAAAIDAFVDGP